jgi:serine/threonine protein kinase
VVEIKGEGEYGATLRVRSDSNIEFAMKVFDKAKLIRDCAQESIFMLRRINLKIAHNLIAKSYRIYFDEHRIYFLNKLISGQTLIDYLSTQSKISMAAVKHFSACMISILEYLHCKRILWREMKLESFIIDSDGYVNLVDLMHLQELKEDEFYIDVPSKASLYYLSPETLSG